MTEQKFIRVEVVQEVQMHNNILAALTKVGRRHDLTPFQVLNIITGGR